MELREFCRTAGYGEAVYCALFPHWERLQENWTGELPAWLSEPYFEEYYPLCRSKVPAEEIRPIVREVIAIARENPTAGLLAHILYRASFELNPWIPLTVLGSELPFYGERGTGVLSLLIAMGSFPVIRRNYLSAGVPEEYARQTLLWMGGNMAEYSQVHHGIPGRPLLFNWIRTYVDKSVFRIGRLEFRMHTMQPILPAIYRDDAGHLAVLCRDGWDFREDGRREPCEKPTFTSRFYEEGYTVKGNRCRPDGTVEHELTTLDLRKWHAAASAWDLCPSIHIPAGGPMYWEEVLDAMKQARQFFQQYFHREVPLFSCCSWILNPSWEELMPDSNMARFRRECFAVPAPSWGPKAGMRFLYGREDVSPEELPADNTAKKAFVKAWRRNQANTGALFVLTDDLERMGNMYYRRTFV